MYFQDILKMNLSSHLIKGQKELSTNNKAQMYVEWMQCFINNMKVGRVSQIMVLGSPFELF